MSRASAFALGRVFIAISWPTQVFNDYRGKGQRWALDHCTRPFLPVSLCFVGFACFCFSYSVIIAVAKVRSSLEVTVGLRLILGVDQEAVTHSW